MAGQGVYYLFNILKDVPKRYLSSGSRCGSKGKGNKMENQIGKTKDTGFQFGIRKTIPVSADKVWSFLFSDSGLDIWLGKLKTDLELEKEFSTKNGITGRVRVIKNNSHIRLNWKPENWENMSTVQIRVMGNENKATIAIHQEKLFNQEQRNEMKAHWTRIIGKLTNQMENQ